MSAFFCKKSAYFAENSAFTQSSNERFFNSVFTFCKIKGGSYENLSFTDYASGIQLPDCSILAMNRKIDNEVTNWLHDIGYIFLLSSLVSIINGSRVTTTYFYEGLPKIQKWEIHPSEFRPISGDWDELGIPNLARMSLIKFY